MGALLAMDIESGSDVGAAIRYSAICMSSTTDVDEKPDCIRNSKNVRCDVEYMLL